MFIGRGTSGRASQVQGNRVKYFETRERSYFPVRKRKRNCFVFR